MKILFFCIYISYSLSADNNTKPTSTQYTLERGSPNEHNLTDDPADRQFSIIPRNERNPSNCSEPEQSVNRNPNFPINSRVFSGYDLQRGGGSSMNYENPNLETSHDECHGGARGTERLQETRSTAGPNSSSGLPYLGNPSTDCLSVSTERYRNVNEGEKVASNMNIRSPKKDISVRPKNPGRSAQSCASSSDGASTNLPSFAGSFGHYCQLLSTNSPTKLLPVGRGSDMRNHTRDEQSVIASTTPVDLNLEQSSNYADPNLVQASGWVGDNQHASSQSVRNALPGVETLEDNNPMSVYVRTIYALKKALTELEGHFGTLELFKESVSLKNSRKSVDIFNEIQKNLKKLASLSVDVDCDRFGIDSHRLNLVLSTVTELTNHIDVYLVEIHYNREEYFQRMTYLMYITKKLKNQLIDFVESAPSELDCLKDESHSDVRKRANR